MTVKEMWDHIEIVERPAMFWLTTGDFWNAHSIIWREEGQHKPYMTIRGRDFDSMIGAIQSFGMKVEMTEDEVKGGHPPEPYPDDDEGTFYWKTTGPVEFHWKLMAPDAEVHCRARHWNELRDFLDEMGVDPPETESPPSVRDGVMEA